MAFRSIIALLLIVGGFAADAQPRPVHIFKAIPLPLINPLQQSVQIGYEYHYHPVRSLHVEAGYVNNELILYDLFHKKILEGVKVRAEHRFYTGGGNIHDLWNDVDYVAPHILLQKGWVNYEAEFPRDGGNYFETLSVKGDFTQVGVALTYGTYLDWFGTFLVELSVQGGIRGYKLSHNLPKDISTNVFPVPWHNRAADTWYLRPMINLTLGLGFAYGNKKHTKKQ